jgi:hypothetical protein
MDDALVACPTSGCAFWYKPYFYFRLFDFGVNFLFELSIVCLVKADEEAPALPRSSSVRFEEPEAVTAPAEPTVPRGRGRRGSIASMTADTVMSGDGTINTATTAKVQDPRSLRHRRGESVKFKPGDVSAMAREHASSEVPELFVFKSLYVRSVEFVTAGGFSAHIASCCSSGS